MHFQLLKSGHQKIRKVSENIMDYFYVVKTKLGYFSGWLPIPEIDEPSFTSQLKDAAAFEYSQAQYIIDILDHNHSMVGEIKKVILKDG